MGLKTTNYVSKSTGIQLPEAYAVLTNLIVETDNRTRAIFAIQASRDAAKQYKALDKVELYFNWDRKADPAVMAYEEAKVQKIEVEVYDEATQSFITKEENGVLFGWENDIVK